MQAGNRTHTSQENAQVRTKKEVVSAQSQVFAGGAAHPHQERQMRTTGTTNQVVAQFSRKQAPCSHRSFLAFSLTTGVLARWWPARSRASGKENKRTAPTATPASVGWEASHRLEERSSRRHRLRSNDKAHWLCLDFINDVYPEHIFHRN